MKDKIKIPLVYNWSIKNDALFSSTTRTNIYGKLWTLSFAKNMGKNTGKNTKIT